MKNFASLDVAKSYAIRNNLTKITDWLDKAKGEDWPDYLPSQPHAYYKVKWSEILAPKPKLNSKFLSFEEACYLMWNMSDVNTIREFRLLGREGQRPSTVPATPDREYAEQWKGYPYFLTGKE